MLTAKLSAPHIRRKASSTKPHTSQSRGRVRSSDCDLHIFSYDVYLRNDDDFHFLLGVWAGWEFICIVAESSRLTHTRMDARVVNVKHTYAHRATHTHSHAHARIHRHTRTHPNMFVMSHPKVVEWRGWRCAHDVSRVYNKTHVPSTAALLH